LIRSYTVLLTDPGDLLNAEYAQMLRETWVKGRGEVGQGHVARLPP
jgi:hypothetical protein